MVTPTFNLVDLPLAQIRPHRKYHRMHFGIDWRDERLVNSIAELGILTPLVVTENQRGSYVVLDGWRRYRAARRAGVDMVPCSVYPKLRELDFLTLRWELNTTRRRITKGEVARWWRENRDALPPDVRDRVYATVMCMQLE